MTQMALVGFARGERDRIMDAIASNHRTYLEFIRSLAREIAARSGNVSIDEVRAEMAQRDWPMPEEIGADARVFGALFRVPEFVPVGRRVTRRAEVAARVGRARSEVTVYEWRVKA